MKVTSTKCIAECRKCITKCQKCCQLNKNKASMKECCKCCKCCIIICNAVCEMLKCDDCCDMTKRLCMLCASCCKKCATQCAKFKDNKVCKDCSVACKTCETACKRCGTCKTVTKKKAVKKKAVKKKIGKKKQKGGEGEYVKFHVVDADSHTKGGVIHFPLTNTWDDFVATVYKTYHGVNNVSQMFNADKDKIILSVNPQNIRLIEALNTLEIDTGKPIRESLGLLIRSHIIQKYHNSPVEKFHMPSIMYDEHGTEK